MRRRERGNAVDGQYGNTGQGLATHRTYLSVVSSIRRGSRGRRRGRRGRGCRGRGRRGCGAGGESEWNEQHVGPKRENAEGFHGLFRRGRGGTDGITATGRDFSLYMLNGRVIAKPDRFNHPHE